MPPIPFSIGQASGYDELSGAPPLVLNAMADVTGTLKGRPGISAWASFPGSIPNASPVDLMIPFGNYLVYVTRDRQLWALDPGGVTVTALSDGSDATRLAGVLHPMGLALQDKVVIVGGGEPQIWTGAGMSSRLTPSVAEWPVPYATHIANIATRLVLARNEPSGIFQWSFLGVPGHLVWDPYNYAEAEAKSDILKAIATNTNELFAFGAETLQVYSPDPNVGFATGRASNVGLLAPYSLVTFDDMFTFVEREKRIVITDGRGFGEDSVISKPINKSLRGLTRCDDAWGFRMRVDRWDAGIWMFPTDGKGFTWNRDTNTWSEWRAWGALGYQAPAITSAVYWPERDVHLVGLSTGQIAKLDAEAYTDLGDTIRIELQTGFVNHGTNAHKASKSARFVFKRGQASGPNPVAISWRDDTGAWVQPRMRDLGRPGEYQPVIELRSTGVYRQRQWKVEYTSAADFTFVTAEEDVEPLAA